MPPTKLSPLDIVNLTPKSNCGQCSYPSCLAFGAAVTRGGEDPGKCPHLDQTRLDRSRLNSNQDLDALQTERDLGLITTLRDKIRPLDFAKLPDSHGVTRETGTPDRLLFTYLGQEVVLSRTGILLDGREPEDPRDQILLYNYIASPGGPHPSGPWVGMESLPNSISKIKTLAIYCEEKIARLFSDQGGNGLIKLGTGLGGYPDPAEHGATASIIIPVLPRIPQYLLFWAAEPADNFPAQTKVLFDQEVLRFLDLESLIFSAERLAESLIALKG